MSTQDQPFHAPSRPVPVPDATLRANLQRHVRVLGGDIGERNIERLPALRATEEYISESFAAYGLTARPHAYTCRGVEVRNLEAELPGQTRGTEVVVVGAHYDTVPGSPGANDNGTGVAAMLELARVLQSNGLDRTLRLVAFVNEEPPYFKTREMGSLVYARACRRRRDRVTAMLSLETIGYYSERPRTQVYPPLLSVFYPDRGNFIGFVGNWRSRRLVRRTVACFRRHTAVPVQSAALPALLPGIAWSDHWSFWRSGYKALMVTDTAPFRYPHYHTARDTPNKIDYDRTTEVVAALEHVVRDLTNGE